MHKITIDAFNAELLKIAAEKTHSSGRKTLTDLIAGALGGAVGAVVTQPIDLVANSKQLTHKPARTIIKEINAEALSKLPKDAGKLQKGIALIKRYNAGLGWKLLKIAPASGAAYATFSYITDKIKKHKDIAS